MANISHKNLPNAQLHECKGASAASAGKVSIANGAGASVYSYHSVSGSTAFVNTSTPYVLTYPTTFTKLAPTTIASGVAVEVTEATTARVTYTGTGNLVARLIANISMDHAAGANRDIEIALYKNGTIVPRSNIVTTAASGFKQLITSIADVTLVTNDYIECYAKNNGASGDINIYTFYLTLIGSKASV